MSIIKPIKPDIQPRRRGGIEDTEAKKNRELSKKEIKAVAGAGIGGLVFLFLIAWLLLPLSAKIIPFVVAAALPLFTLLAVIYQAIVYRRQWNAMQSALKQTDRVIEKMQAQLTAIREQTGVMQNSLTETQKMAKHSERGTEIAKQNMECGQRAYVSITKKELRRGAFLVYIENSGNTPAREVMVQCVVNAGLWPPELSTLTNPPQPSLPEITIFLGLLAPKSPEQILVPFNRELTAEERANYWDQADIFHWWIRGVISYRDIFHETMMDYRVTKFCFFYDQQAQAVRANSSGNEEEEYRDGKRVDALKYPDWWVRPKA
jgi:hypothetical protein